MSVQLVNLFSIVLQGYSIFVNLANYLLAILCCPLADVNCCRLFEIQVSLSRAFGRWPGLGFGFGCGVMGGRGHMGNCG